MKKFLSVILLISAIFTLSVFAEEAKPVTVTLNGKTVDCASYGQEATIVEGRTMVPLRAIFEALGASVEWNQETKTVTSNLGGTEIFLTIGENKLIKNGEEIALDVPAMIMNGRTLVPVRAVSESFGVAVEWDAETRTVILSGGVLAYNAYLDGVLEAVVPKSDLDKEILAYAGGLPVSAATVRSAVMAACVKGQDLSDENTIKELEAFYTQNAVLVEFAYRDGVVLEEVDINRIKASVTGLQIQLGENYQKAFAESPYTEYFYYQNSALYSVVFTKLAELYGGSNNPEIKNKVLEFLDENEYVRAKHILIQFPGANEGREPNESERIQTLNKALEVLVKVNAMKDISEFDALIKEYNEDPGMEMNPDGYYFTKGEMVEPFEKATYALEEGKTSSVVETNYGYHIILRLPVDDEKLTGSYIYSSVAENVLGSTLIQIAYLMEVDYTENYATRVEDFKDEYEILMSQMN